MNRIHTLRFAWVALFTAALVTSATAAEPQVPATPSSASVVAKVERAVERGAKAAASGIERGAKAAEHGIKVGVHAAARGVEAGAKAVARAADSVASKVRGQ